MERISDDDGESDAHPNHQATIKYFNIQNSNILNINIQIQIF
jgi:hypothetical protein